MDISESMENVDVVTRILGLSYEIYNLYLELFKLELSGKKSESKYLAFIADLKELVNEERELYDILAGDKDNYLRLLNFVQDDLSKPLFLRMYGYLLLNGGPTVVEYQADCDELIGQERELSNLNRLYRACSKDMFLVYLSFIEEYVGAKSFGSMREKLIYNKYYTSFIIPDVEEFLIESKFEVDKINYVESYFVSLILRMDKSITESEILDGYLDMIVGSMVSLLNVKNNEYDDEDRRIDIIKNECMFRAGLCLLSENEYEGLKESIVNVLNDLSCDENTVSIEVIKSIIDGRKKDKCRVKKLCASEV